MTWFFLFVFGAAIGSFLNVVDLRYDGDHFVFDAKVLGGRSHCPHCKKTLHWYELIPVVSFVIQGGRCRGCKRRISFQYPVVEAISGLVFLFVPFRMAAVHGGAVNLPLAVLWIAAFETLLLISLIDLKLGIIPDELNAAVGVIGIFIGIMLAGNLGLENASLIGPYALIFGGQMNIWLARIAGALAGGAFFSALVFVTRGKGMGMGDVKLALAMGLLFGWPDIALAVAAAFMLGAIAGIALMAFRKKTMQSSLPFGPFLAMGAAVIFFFGIELVSGYFRLMGL